LRHAITFLATGAYVGLLPVAPGTFGSLLAIPLLVGIARLGLPAAVTVGMVAGIVALAVPICGRAEREYGQADSGRIVLDEVCGMLVAGVLIAPAPWTLGLVFVVFRVLDVLKPFPAGYIDRRVTGGAGVVGDDVVAGLYTNLLVRALLQVRGTA
jgi:phosphatidylglycerophosphatase A